MTTATPRPEPGELVNLRQACRMVECDQRTLRRRIALLGIATYANGADKRAKMVRRSDLKHLATPLLIDRGATPQE